MNKVFTTFKFVSTYPQLKQFINEAHDYEELSSERSFKNCRSGGTYSDKDIDKKLEEIENKLTEKIYKYLVDNNTYIITFDDAKQQLIIGKSDKEINDLINTYNYSQLIKDDGYDINSVELFKDWFNNNDYINIDRNADRVKEDIKVKKENKKISLEEATLQALAAEANSISDKDIEEIEEPDEAEGIMDGIIVVTDPETDTKDYEEIIEKAQDIMENTPEGEIPFDEEYLGQYMMTCPLCGTTFIEPEILEPGATCPVCLDTPESFIVVGKVEGDDEVNEDMEEVQETNLLDDSNVQNEDNEESELKKDIASKQIIDDNKLTESIPGMDIFEHQDEYPEINLDLYGSDAQEAIIYIENNINKLNIEQLHELADKVFMEDINDVKEFMKYLASSDDEDIIEIYNEFKKYIPENIEESKDITSKEFEVINATESDIQALEKGSAFTWEGMATSEDNLQSIVDFFKENTPTVKLPIKFYIWSGKTMNDLYSLTKGVAYPDDLSFVSIPLDCWSDLGNLPIIKFQVGARWLDDIVDNNKVHMGNSEGLDECLNNNLVSKKLNESLNIKGLENFDNIANTFEYYSAYEANFKPLIIIKMDKTYYIYRSDAKSYNDYIDYSNSKDYIDGWLHGAVKVKNKVVEDKLFNETIEEETKLQNSNDKDDKSLREVINQDGFPNDETLQQYFQDLKNLPDEVEIEGVKYKIDQYGGSGDNAYAIYTDINNDNSYIKVFYSLNKLSDKSYKGIKEIKGVSDLRENKDLEEKYDPSKFDSLDEELSYLYARIDQKENEMAARYIKDANITNPDILDREIENSLNKDDGYKAIINRIQEIENLKQQK